MAPPGKVHPSHMAELLSIHVEKAFDQATCGCMSSAPSLARRRSARAISPMIRTALVIVEKIETALDPDSKEKSNVNGTRDLDADY